MIKKFVAYLFFFCAVLSVEKIAGFFDSQDSSSKTHSVTAGKKTVYTHYLENFRFRSTKNDINDWDFDKLEKNNTEKLVAAVCAKVPQQDDSSNEDTSTDSSKD